MHHEDIHPFVVEAAQAIALTGDDGAKMSIPAAKYKELSTRVKGQRRDLRLFEHLVVMYARLDRGGLTAAAQQLLALAKIGLAPDALAETLKRADDIEKSLAAVDTHATKQATASAIGGGDVAAAKAAASRINASRRDPKALVSELLAMRQDEERKACLQALRAHKPHPTSFADLVGCVEDGKAREKLVVDFGGFLGAQEKADTLRALSAHAREPDAVAVCFLLQFAPKKDLPALLAAAAGFPSDVLRPVAEGVNLADGRALADALASARPPKPATT